MTLFNSTAINFHGNFTLLDLQNSTVDTIDVSTMISPIIEDSVIKVLILNVDHFRNFHLDMQQDLDSGNFAHVLLKSYISEAREVTLDIKRSNILLFKLRSKARLSIAKSKIEAIPRSGVTLTDKFLPKSFIGNNTHIRHIATAGVTLKRSSLVLSLVKIDYLSMSSFNLFPGSELYLIDVAIGEHEKWPFTVVEPYIITFSNVTVGGKLVTNSSELVHVMHIPSESQYKILPNSTFCSGNETSLHCDFTNSSKVRYFRFI